MIANYLGCSCVHYESIFELRFDSSPGEGPSFFKQGIQLFRSPVEPDGQTQRRARALRSVARFDAKSGRVALASQHLADFDEPVTNFKVPLGLNCKLLDEKKQKSPVKPSQEGWFER
jgi:hypothetical protein